MSLTNKNLIILGRSINNIFTCYPLTSSSNRSSLEPTIEIKEIQTSGEVKGVIG